MPELQTNLTHTPPHSMPRGPGLAMREGCPCSMRTPCRAEIDAVAADAVPRGTRRRRLSRCRRAPRQSRHWPPPLRSPKPPSPCRSRRRGRRRGARGMRRGGAWCKPGQSSTRILPRRGRVGCRGTPPHANGRESRRRGRSPSTPPWRRGRCQSTRRAPAAAAPSSRPPAPCRLCTRRRGAATPPPAPPPPASAPQPLQPGPLPWSRPPSPASNRRCRPAPPPPP
mmetsp:Transcript_12868/g.41060  ORF Transcript_12868/g.41060 Transcript_12868/m.41060 type:complete len:225 (+) Transcript_12868:93-767(+)